MARRYLLAMSALLMFAADGMSSTYAAETSSIGEATSNSRQCVDIQKIVEGVSSRNKMRFLIDPRVRACVDSAGVDLGKVTYRELQSILTVHGFATVESNGLTLIVPDATIRQLAVPIVSDRGGNYTDDDVVVRLIKVKNVEAASLVPILRPLLPQYAHMAAMQAADSLVIVDHYGNIKKIESIVRQLDAEAKDSQAQAKPISK